MPIDIRLDQSLPAFTNCSLDDDPGAGRKIKEPKKIKVGKEVKVDQYDGDPQGQVNRYLYWKTQDVIDTPRRWEITVALTPKAPKAQCTVDITPRRLQKFKLKPNDRIIWKNILENLAAQSGSVTVDKSGLATLKQVNVHKKGNRLILSRSK